VAGQHGRLIRATTRDFKPVDHHAPHSIAARKRIVLAHDNDVTLGDAVAAEPKVDARLLADKLAETVREAVCRPPGHWQRPRPVPSRSASRLRRDIGPAPATRGSIGATRGRCLARLRVLPEAP
jgi:hypothetical protein